jgi:hypothetical protein
VSEKRLQKGSAFLVARIPMHLADGQESGGVGQVWVCHHPIRSAGLLHKSSD